MTLVSLPVSPSLVALPGDKFVITGDQLEQWRGVTRVAHRTLNLDNATRINQPTVIGPQVITSIILELPMPAYEVTITSIVYAEDGKINVTYSDGGGNEFNDRAALEAYAIGLDSPDYAKIALIRAWSHKSPDFSDPSWALNRTARLDLANQLSPLEFA